MAKFTPEISQAVLKSALELPHSQIPAFDFIEVS